MLVLVVVVVVLLLQVLVKMPLSMDTILSKEDYLALQRRPTSNSLGMCQVWNNANEEKVQGGKITL